MPRPLLILTLLALAARPAPGGDLTADLDRIAARSFAAWKPPGLAVAVVKGDATVLLKGYGVTAAGGTDPVTPRTLFPMGSCTKALTATLLASLADDGKLALDDPVKKYLPGFRLADPAAADVTLRDAMSHRTGLGAHDYLWYRAPWNRAEVIRRAAFLEPAYPFRKGYTYSSVPVIAAGQAAANAGGAPWEALVRDRLLTPLKMGDTVLTSAEAARVPGRARGAARTPTGVAAMPEYELTEANPAGSAFTTAADAANWLRFQIDGGAFAGKQVVGAANLRETRTPTTPMPRTDPEIAAVYPLSTRVDYALGWAVYDYRGREVVAHGGVTDGFRALVLFVPKEKVGVALFVNLHQTKMAVALAHSLLDRLLNEEPARDWDEYFQTVGADEAKAKAAALAARDAARNPAIKPTATPAATAGRYAHPAYGDFAVTADAAGQLSFTWGGFSGTLEPYEGETYRVPAGPLADQLVEFRNRTGTPDALRFLGLIYAR
jgi:CubicO group peptidase (beta-lactamase class C family)